MKKNNNKQLWKRVGALLLITALFVTAIPATSLVGEAKSTKQKASAWDGSFESAVLDETPTGWQLVTATNGGEFEKDTSRNFTDNYRISVVKEANSGNKSMVIEGLNNQGTRGYVFAQSDAISVEGNSAYSFDYAMKIQGVESYEYFLGGRVYVCQYDKNGKELQKSLMGNYIRENMEWESFSKYIQTDPKTVSVKLLFYIGGTWTRNVGIQLFVDDISFDKIPDNELLNGNFEKGSGQNDIYSWHLTSKTIKNEVTTADFWRNYSMSREKNGYHGDAIAIRRNGIGYVSMDSNMMKLAEGGTYIVDYALRIEGAGETFQGVRVYAAEYDENQKLIQTIALHPLFKEDMDWTELSYAYTPSKTATYFQLEFWCGDYGKADVTFTAYFDDVRLTTILRNTSEDGVNNGNFEEVYDGTVFDWEMEKREDTAFSSTFDGYNGTKGLYCVKTSVDKHGYAAMTSNRFAVKGGEDYKLTYMARMENLVGNVYIVANLIHYDAAGNKLEVQRIQKFDHKLDNDKTVTEAWQNVIGYYKIPEKAAYCELLFQICGTSYECWLDDVTWSIVDQEANIYGFEAVDAAGNLSGWTCSQPTAVKADKETYRQGSTSLFVSHTENTAYTQVVSDVLIPVNRDTRYKFTTYIKSYNCNVDSEGIRLNAWTYDKDGNYIGEIEGLRMSLNEESKPSNWRQLICGVSAGARIAYVRMIVEVSTGSMNFWLDDLSWKIYDTYDEYYEDFDSVCDDGSPDGWSAVAVSGTPSFVTKDSMVAIKADKAEDVGMITTRWDTAREYTTLTYTTTYATTDSAKGKISLKFYDYMNQEIEGSRLEKTLDSTNGEFVDYTFDFLLPAVKYATVELSNEGSGTLSFTGLSMVKKRSDDAEKEKDNSTWRGDWIWHQEDYLDSENSTPRYFRYHVALPDDPVEGNLQITADDNLRLWINGVEIVDQSMSEHWENISVIDNVADYMKAGDNVIAVSVVNFTSYAGLLFDGYVATEDETWIDFYSTEAAVSSLTEYNGWYEKDYDDSAWANCKIIEYYGGSQWGTQAVFDASALVKNKFEVLEYSITEELTAGEEAMLTMTVVPEIDITTKMNLRASLWVRNTETRVLSIDLEQVDGPSIHEWKAGEKVTVSYTFDILDYIGTGKYTLQLDINQVRITNMEIMNNKFTQAIRVNNQSAEESMKTKIVEVNGTFAMDINGELQPLMSYTIPNKTTYKESDVADYMHDAGICITRTTAFPSGAAIWTGYDEYNWDVVDEHIYAVLADHPDTYLFISPDLDVPNWWLEDNPDEVVLTSDGDTPGVSFASEKFVEDATKTNVAMIEHMKQQPYWNRVVGVVLCGARTSEWLWYGGGQESIDHSVSGQASWKKWLQEKYGTDAVLQEAWNDKSVTLENVHVPTFEERAGDTYTTLLNPATQQDVLDYADYMGERVADVLMDFTAAITEAVNDNLIIGTYYGYLIQRVYYYDALTVIHTAVDRVLEDENLDFMAAPTMYGERYDGEAAGFMHMVNGALAHGMALVMEEDLRVCSWENLSSNFFTRDEVGPTYTMSDSISQMEKSFASEVTANVGSWYFNLEGGWFEREQFSELIETIRTERIVDLAREKDCEDDVCFIIDEDMYENLAFDFYANYEVVYWMILEQRYELARIGVSVDCYSMTDLEDGLVPDHKIYLMLSPVEMDASERAAVEKYLKNKDKVVVWQYICGASDDKTFSAKNMSDVIGMDVTLDGTKRSLSAVISDDTHWLTEGMGGRFYGNTGSRDKVSPTAIVTDKEAEVLAYMSDNASQPALAIKDMGAWTSVYSAVPNIPTELIRNLLDECDVHTYSDNLNDVIFNNSNYVGINCAYGGDKEIKLDDSYAVYDVFGRTTYSLSTDTIHITMDDNSTKLYRLTPADKHVVYVDVGVGGSSKQEGYQEVKPGKDYDCKIKAKDGYVISAIIVDGNLTETKAKTYTVTFDNLNNSHFVEAQFEKVSQDVETFVEENEDQAVTWVILTIMIALVLVAAVVILLIKLKKKNMQQQTMKEERDGQ